jgi:hypothetical protein
MSPQIINADSGLYRDFKVVVNWKTKAQEQDGWRVFLEQAKSNKGL